MKQISFYTRKFYRWTGFVFVLLGFVGCSQQVQHEYAAENTESKVKIHALSTPKMAVKNSPLPSDLPPVNLPLSSDPLEMVSRIPEATLSPIDELTQRIRLESRLYLAKDNSLLGDFTVVNHHPVPISQLRVECAEYNPNQVLLKTFKRLLGKTQKIAPEAQQFFGEIDFGYVDDEFDTVTCHLYSAKLH